MNSPGLREKRLPPERIGPIRNPLARDNGRPASRPEPTSDTARRGPLEYGVQTAYAVIDEYMQRGYEAARHNQDNQDGKGHMNSDRYRYNYGGNGFNAWGPLTPVMEAWLAAMRTWTDAWSALLLGGRQAACSSQAYPSQPYPSQPCTPGGAPSAVTVNVTSKRSTQAVAILRPGAELLGLRADSLSCQDVKTQQPIENVSINCIPARVEVNVKVDDEKHKPGRYWGAIRARDGSIVGDLTVVIPEPGQYT